MRLINLMLMSLDGEIASHKTETSSQRLDLGMTNSDDQELLHREIQACDAVIIGARTVRTEGALLDLKNGKGRYPTWCVYTRQGLEASLPFWKQDAIPRVLVSPEAIAIENPKVESLRYGSSKPGAYLLDALKKRGFVKLLLLGGGDLNRIFYEEGLVDELKLTIAPLLLGKSSARLVEPDLDKTVNFELLSSEARGSHLFLHYAVKR